MWLISVGEREKNAISDADTKPETTSNSIAITTATIPPSVGVENVIGLTVARTGNMRNI
jgi:hypothetical protein